MTKFDRITIDPARMNGQPTIRNLRLTVRRVIEGTIWRKNGISNIIR